MRTAIIAIHFTHFDSWFFLRVKVQFDRAALAAMWREPPDILYRPFIEIRDFVIARCAQLGGHGPIEMQSTCRSD